MGNESRLKMDRGCNTEEIVSFNSLLKDPIKIERVISALIAIKNDIIDRDLSRINNTILSTYVANRLQDFSNK
jgi:hypothetical protein